MYYESSDFLETADSDTLKQIARTRELTREYYFSDYGDIEKRTSILRELLGGIGENVLIDTPFHCETEGCGPGEAGGKIQWTDQASCSKFHRHSAVHLRSVST